MSQTRQLAAIMFTDIVGYTALMGQDEQKAFEILQKNRNLQRPIIEEYSGRWIKELGDGILASFNTVSDAVNAAIKIQEACIIAKDILLRIGIHQGEVVFEQDDIFGDAVNIASRIQAIAAPGGIYVSESVHNNISNKQGIETGFVKIEDLKNVKEPVRIYEILSNRKTGPSNSETKEPVKKAVRSLAVLPFVDMSPAYDQEYLGDGLAEELINLLSQIRELKVIGRTSSFSFKKKDIDLKTIGKTLNAATILEGSVQKSGNRIRITAQLVNAEDGYHIWSQRYDREMDDIFALQDDISSRIAEHLRLTLLEDHETATEKRPTGNLEAYELFLKGNFYHAKYTAEAIEKAIEYFKNALELDPNYADAWWLLGLANFDMQLMHFLSAKERVEIARNCIQKAIEIDKSNHNAHFLLALIHLDYDWDWEKAGLETAIGNKYNQKQDSYFLPMEGWYRSMLFGDADFAARRLEKGVIKDPLSITLLLHLAMVYLYACREFEKTRTVLTTILELDPSYSKALGLMAMSYLYEGKTEPALKNAQNYFNALEGKGHGAACLIMCLAASGEKEEALQLYNSVKEAIPSNSFSSSLHAEVNAYLEQPDDAFEYLDKAIQNREHWLFTLKYSSEWDLFRTDPRFEKILERMKFPQ